MGPRPSISGELPLESYFSSAGRTAGPSGTKGNRSLKRKNAADASESDAAWAPTKKPKMKAPCKSSHAGPESKADHTRSKELRVSGASRTTSMPTPNSIMKPPLRPPVHIPDDVDVISIPSSSPTQTAPLSARATAHSSSKNTSSLFGLPTPQTVSHGSRTRSRADSASRLHSVTESRSVAQAGLPFPQTPSRSKTKFDVDHTTHTPRTTPQSQRIVPSSQFFADEQASLASSLERIADGGDPFQSREPDEELTLPSLFKLPLPPTRAPTTVSSSFPFASVSSNGFSSRHRSQNSQIVPTSQFDEVELKFSSDSQAIPLPVRSPLAKHNKSALSLKPLELGPPQNPSPRSKDKVTQEPSEDIHDTPPDPPPSPLTPLTPSSPRAPDAECEKVSTLESDELPLQHKPDEPHRVSSIPPSPEPPADKAIPLSKSDIPDVEDPTSDEGENFVVNPSPVRRQSQLQASSPSASHTPSASTHRHLRISHAKLRRLPAAAVELDSDGEEMSSDTSIDMLPSSPGVSCPASSYLDLHGTLPPEVEEFLDMVGTNASSDS
ncbi:hypothetical protein V8E53_014696 [Lactarius tabidus]